MGSTARRSAVLLLKDLTKVCGCPVPSSVSPIPLMGAVSPGQEVLCLMVIPIPVRCIGTGALQQWTGCAWLSHLVR